MMACLAAFLLVGPAIARSAYADDTELARGYVEKATAAYALNKYAVAAENFEKAFELKPDPALLYNAAQSYRLAGNKERALQLYESYARVYPKEKKRPEIEAHIKQLKQAIEHDRAVATSPPITTDPVAVGQSPSRTTPPPAAPAPVAPAPAPAAAPAAAPPPAAPVTPIASAATDAPAAAPAAPPPASPSSSVVLTQSADTRSKDEPLTSKTWFWVAVGGGVAVAALVVILLASGGSNPASASLGKASGN